MGQGFYRQGSYFIVFSYGEPVSAMLHRKYFPENIYSIWHGLSVQRFSYWLL